MRELTICFVDPRLPTSVVENQKIILFLETQSEQAFSCKLSVRREEKYHKNNYTKIIYFFAAHKNR